MVISYEKKKAMGMKNWGFTVKEIESAIMEIKIVLFWSQCVLIKLCVKAKQILQKDTQT